MFFVPPIFAALHKHYTRIRQMPGGFGKHEMGPTATSRSQIDFNTHQNHFNAYRKAYVQKRLQNLGVLAVKVSFLHSAPFKHSQLIMALYRKGHVFIPHQRVLQYKKTDQSPLTMRLVSQ